MPKKNKQKSKMYGKAIAFWSVILIIVLLISILIPWLFDQGEKFPWFELLKSVSYMTLGIIIFAISAYIFELDQHEKYRDAFARQSIIKMLVVVFIVLVVSFISMSIFIETNEPWLKIFENPGGIFTIIIGAITILGFYLTIETLVDYKYKISSFNELIDHVCELVEKTNPGEKIKYLTATPLIGSLSVDDYSFNKLKNQIQSRYSDIDMITLDRQTLTNYNNLFLDRTTRRGTGTKIKQSLIDDVQNNCENVINHIKIDNLTFPPKRLPDSKMPGYYIIANSSKAIIATPFFMPFPMNQFKGGVLKSLPIVTMFGFVTTDPKIVSDAIKMFEEISEL